MAAHDPLLPWLWSIKEAIEDSSSENDSRDRVLNLLSDCVSNFKGNQQYRNDTRFLKIWILYMGVMEDFENAFKEMMDSNVCVRNSSLYVWSACFLESKGKLQDAHKLYQLGISRNAEPISWLKKAHTLFLSRVSELVNVASVKVDDKTCLGDVGINPWSASILKDLLKKINPLIIKYDGYHSYPKAYSGKVALSSLRNASCRNKMLELGGKKYQIKGCAGKGGFAQVYKAFVNSSPDDVVALKIQKPAYPWEFYMYRQIDFRISEKERSSFGYAHRLHLYSDCSILVCDYLAHGTLHDVINSYAVQSKSMEEILCIYYTIEMLHMLENLHDVGIIHGDFKPDNLLIRYSRDELTEEGFIERTGPWRNQGLCLVDWGRGIDLLLFPEYTKFRADCRTSGFRCIEMQENKPWRFQVDTYALCVVVHTMLHGSYMEIVKKASSNGDFIYHPKLPFKRYWNVELWKYFFSELLNHCPGDDDKSLLRNVRESFQTYLYSDTQLMRKLKELLVKQKTSLCSS